MMSIVISRWFNRTVPYLAAFACLAGGAAYARPACARVPSGLATGPACAVASPFDAAEPTLPVPRLEATALKAGDRVTLRWNGLRGVAEELELVFSMDDGRRFDVRVSPQLDGGESRFVWRVPNVGVHAGRVRLRARIAGHERIGPASEPFQILPEPLRPAGLWVFRQGEWWEEAGGKPFTFPGLMAPPAGPSLGSDLDAPPLTAPDRAKVAGRPAPFTALDPAYRFETDGATPPVRRVPPSFRPMRE